MAKITNTNKNKLLKIVDRIKERSQALSEDMAKCGVTKSDLYQKMTAAINEMNQYIESLKTN